MLAYNTGIISASMSVKSVNLSPRFLFSLFTDDEVCNIALQCIPCILPVGSQKVKGKGKRATIEDALTSFVDLQKVS